MTEELREKEEFRINYNSLNEILEIHDTKQRRAYCFSFEYLLSKLLNINLKEPKYLEIYQYDKS